jgi:hypothetical protein
MVHSPRCAGDLLLGDPVEHDLAAIADVPTETDVWDEPSARVLADPALGHGEQFGDLGRGEEAIAHALLACAAFVSDGSSGREEAPEWAPRAPRALLS